MDYIIPFLINHGYFYYNIEKYFPNNSSKIKLFWDLSLNNYDLLFNKKNNNIDVKSLDNNYLLYYLSYLIRIGITDYIHCKNKSIIYDILLKNDNFKFIRLKRLINELDKEKNDYYNKYIQYEDINENITILLNYLVNFKLEEKSLKDEDIINYLDIGSSLSLLLITIYFNKNYKFYAKLKTMEIFDLFNKLYLLCNLISSSSINYFSYNKKLILFSLFSVFNVSPLPYNNTILNKKVFEIFNSINGCLLNCNSILFSDRFFNVENNFLSKFFDIFSNKNEKLYKNIYFEMFNLEKNNIIINYSILPILFRFMLSKLVDSIFYNNYKSMEYTPNIFNDQNEITNEGHYYSSILYYYNQLIFYSKDDRTNSLENFLNIIFKNFTYSYDHFPIDNKNDENNNNYYFYLDDYLKDLMLNNNTKPNLIYSFLINYLNERKPKDNTKDNSFNKNEVFLLIFLLKDIWNINFSSDSSFLYQYLNYSYLKKLKICLDN